MQRVWLGLIAALALLLAACGGSTPGEDAAAVQNHQESEAVEAPEFKTAAEVMNYVKDMPLEQREAVLLAGAKREQGPLLFYSAMDEKHLSQLPGAFEKSYPDLSLEIWRGDGTAQVYTRTLNEFRAGSDKADVIDLDFYYAYDLNKSGVLTPHWAPNIKDYPAGLYDPDGLWSGFYVKIYCLTWNTNRTTEAGTPDAWQDLADPAYKGNFSLDTNEDYVLFYLRKRFGEEEGTQLAKQIAANQPRMIRGHSHQMALLEAGEFDFAAAMFDMNPIRDIADKHAPVDLKYLQGPLLVSPDGDMMLKNTPHPYGAVLLKDWLALPAGQQTVANLNFVAPLPGVSYEIDRMGQVLQQKDVFSITAADYGPVREQTARDYAQIFGLTQ